MLFDFNVRLVDSAICDVESIATVPQHFHRHPMSNRATPLHAEAPICTGYYTCGKHGYCEKGKCVCRGRYSGEKCEVPPEPGTCICINCVKVTVTFCYSLPFTRKEKRV